jgi:hypothetical protein
MEMVIIITMPRQISRFWLRRRPVKFGARRKAAPETSGKRRIVAGPKFCGGREQFAVLSVCGEAKLTERAIADGSYEPFDGREL